MKQLCSIYKWDVWEASLMLCCCVPKNGISKAYGDTSWAPIHTILDSLTWILPFVYDQELHKTYSDSIWAHISLDFKNVHFNYIYILKEDTVGIFQLQFSLMLLLTSNFVAAQDHSKCNSPFAHYVSGDLFILFWSVILVFVRLAIRQQNALHFRSRYTWVCFDQIHPWPSA